MHPYVIPPAIRERVIRRQGKLISHDTIDAAHTALVVVDMQNYYVAKGFPLETPMAREIVPNINRLAHSLRAAGGTVAWVQTTSVQALKKWANHHKFMLKPEIAQTRIAHLDESAKGFELYPNLEPSPSDIRVKKGKYSAFIQGSSDIDAQLKGRGIERILVTGTVTNVCCESTARDAMMLDYRVIMVSDGNAANSDEDHAATLNNFINFFGDVLTTDEIISRLNPGTVRRTA